MADTRFALVTLSLLLASCSGTEAAPEQQGDAIACAVGGGSEVADQCMVEKVREDGATVLVVHHPDGAFRRFTALPSGGLIATDGADRATVTESADTLTVALAGDRYVVPRTLLVADAQ